MGTRGYSLAELRDGTGFRAGARFVEVPPTAASMVRFVTFMGSAPLWEKKPGVMICTQEHSLGLSLPEARQLLHDLAQAINEGVL